MSQPYPTDLQIVDTHDLVITWSDGSHRRYAASDLRAHCPCATCRQPAEAADPPADGDHALSIQRMRPVGNYAYSITFSDGHDTGIYTFDLLRRLGAETL